MIYSDVPRIVLMFHMSHVLESLSQILKYLRNTCIYDETYNGVIIVG
jgi:hypothetical protein